VGVRGLRVQETLSLCRTPEKALNNLFHKIITGVFLTTVFDVPAHRLIPSVAAKLKELPDAKPPAWLRFVKSGAHAQRAPQQKGFWHIRCASILRKLYLNEPVGVRRLRTAYGGRKKRGVKRERRAKAGGSIIRKALQQLEALGFVEKRKEGGRRLTKKGRSFLDNAAREVAKAG